MPSRAELLLERLALFRRPADGDGRIDVRREETLPLGFQLGFQWLVALRGFPRQGHVSFVVVGNVAALVFAHSGPPSWRISAPLSLRSETTPNGGIRVAAE